MHPIISILFSAIFMLVTTGSLAQDTVGDVHANKQSPICLTHRINDATGDCRNVFMQAFSALSQKCGSNKTLDEVSAGYVNEYMSVCGCSSECRQ